MLVVLFIIWLALCAWLAGNILKKLFPVSDPVNYILGAFLSIIILGLTANIFTAWLKLTDLLIIAAFIITIIALSAWHYFFRKLTNANPAVSDDNPALTNSLSPFIWLLFIASLIGGFYFIIIAANAGGLSSPWQILPPWFLLPILIGFAVIFLAVFHGEKAWKILGAIIIFSFLIHSYLFVYSNGFGGDRFRHLASEERIIAGLDYQPTLLTDNLWLKQIGPLKVPAAFIDSAKLSYGFEWSLEVIASKISGISVFQINRFLLPLLWSIFLPLLIYVISKLIWPARIATQSVAGEPDRRIALLAAALGNSFYLLQYYGGQGLPASYGLLIFALAAALWLAWFKAKNVKILLFCLFMSVLSYFNYSLTFILIVIFGTLAESLQFKKIAAIIVGAVSAVVLFILDAGFSPQLTLPFDRLYSAWRDGNFIAYQSGSRLTPYIGQMHLIIDLIFLALFIVGIIWLIIKILRQDNQQANAVVYFFIILMAAYLASWLFVSGDHVLVRRLNLFVVFSSIFIFAYGIDLLIAAQKNKFRLVVVALLAIVSSYVYFSGPVLDVSVTSADLDRASAIWPQIQEQKDVCIKEPIEVILALEYVSAKELQETINNINCKY
ncbi:MAG: hypothetical protein WCT26_02940 [Candidatus Buchananbacteria bacterium]